MSFESTDWGAEAQRIKRAFYLSSEYQFALHQPNGLMYLKDLINTRYEMSVTLSPHRYLNVAYFDDVRWFHYFSTDSQNEVRIHIEADGSTYESSAVGDGGPFLAKPLFHLGLLNPAVETALGVTVSDHEKAEWTREYDERYGL